jgi:phosphatidylglycerophosphate synthase
MFPLILSKNYQLNLLGLLFLLVSMVLDWYDGYIARKLNIQSPFGASFDVFADRLSEVLVFLFFFFIDMIPLAIPVIFLIRGIITDYITSLSIKKFGYEETRKKIFRSKFGKIKISDQVIDLYGVSKALVMIFILSVYIWNLQLGCVVIASAWLITIFNIIRGILVVYDSRKIIKI